MGEYVPSDPNFAARVRDSFSRQGIMVTIGAQLIAVEPGEVTIEFPYTLSLSQHNGYIHAGVMTTAVDSACGYAAYTLMPEDVDVLSIEYKVNFMSPAVGDRFRCVGRVVKAGRTITVCSGDVLTITDGKVKLVATMLATMIAVKK